MSASLFQYLVHVQGLTTSPGERARKFKFIPNFSSIFIQRHVFFLFAFFDFLTLLPFPDFFFHSSDQWVPRRTGISNFEFFPLKFRTHNRLMPVIKGTHAVSYETALTWTLLLPVWKEFTSTQNQMYASATSRNPLQSCLVYHSILDLLQKTSFWGDLTHPMALFYHI